jgi:hypothetical protein
MAELSGLLQEPAVELGMARATTEELWKAGCIHDGTSVGGRGSGWCSHAAAGDAAPHDEQRRREKN